MPAKAYIAVDLGAESGRVIVGTVTDGKLALHETHRFLHLPVNLPSGLHWDLTGLWHNILEGVRLACEWCADHDIEPTSLGVDTWGVDWSMLGESGELIHMPHCYRDPRNVAAYEKTLETCGREYLYDRTGVQFMAINTLYQVVAARDAEPRVFEEADCFLHIPDLLHYWFTGVKKVEASIASTSQMVDPRTGKWATDVLEKMDVPSRMLGEIVPSGTVLGPLLPAVAKNVKAPDSLRVITPATHDTASAVAAVPVDPANGEWCYMSSGTWSLLGAEIDEPCLSEAAREVPFTNEGGVGGTIRFLKNIAGLWLVQETRRHYEAQGVTYDYAKLTELAAAAEPFRTLLDTEHAPFAQPGDMPGKMAEYARNTDQPEPTEPGQCVRAALESLALTYRRTIEAMETVLDTKYDVLHIVGGGGKNTLLDQMTADAIGRPVIVGPYEGTAAGNILVQAIGAGDLADLQAARQVVTASFEPKTYQPADTAKWDEAYERFNALLSQ